MGAVSVNPTMSSLSADELTSCLQAVCCGHTVNMVNSVPEIWRVFSAGAAEQLTSFNIAVLGTQLIVVGGANDCCRRGLCRSTRADTKTSEDEEAILEASNRGGQTCFQLCALQIETRNYATDSRSCGLFSLSFQMQTSLFENQ